MRFTDILLLILLAGSLIGSAGAEKIYLNPSDQIHNMSPDGTYCEADGMKDVGRKLEAKLAARGFEVKNSDGGTMSQATTAANEWPADIYISLHSNAGAGPGWGKAHGTNTLYYLPRDGSGPNPISVKLALLCDEKVVEKMTTYGRGHNFAVVADLPFLNFNLFVLRRTNMPGTLVEGLFHDNEEDTAVLKTEEGRDAYAQGVYEALCDYFGRSYYPDASILDPAGPVANDSTGNLALVVRGEKGNATFVRQTGVNARWSDQWIDLEGNISGEPVIARNPQGRLHVFAQGPGGRVWHKVQAKVGSDRWNGWYDLRGTASGDPVVARYADGRLVVFVVGSDGHLRYKAQRSVNSGLQWDEWNDLGGQVIGEPTVCHGADGQLVVACRAPENGLIVSTQSGDEWTVRNDQDDVVASDPVAVMDREDRLTIFCLGPDGHIMGRTGNIWQDLGGTFVSSPAVGVGTDGALEVFALDGQGAISHNSQDSDGKWIGWQMLGGTLTGAPMIARNLDGRIEVFARRSDGEVQYRVQREPGKSAIWDGWYTVGENFTATVREYPPSQ